MQTSHYIPQKFCQIFKKLRSHSCITERYLTKKQVGKIKYETVPAHAMLKYKTTFQRHDSVRFSRYINKVTNNNGKIHSDTLFPYEILKPYFNVTYLSLEHLSTLNIGTEKILEAFENAGYELPAVVFHNVNSWQKQMPVSAHTKGAALVSGSGKSNFKHKFDGNITPMNHMLRVLNSKR